MKVPFSASLIIGFLAIGLLSAPAAAAPGSGQLQIQSLDTARRIDVNRINMFVSNYGWFAFDPMTGSPGLLYPKGSTTTSLFAGGLWLGLLSTPARIALAEYSSEYGPGSILSPGVWENPEAPDLVVYKVARWTGNPTDSAHVERTPAELAADPTLDPLLHHSWSEYVAGAASRGAPWRLHRLPFTETPSPGDSVDVPGPDVAGDQMLWCVFNDADPSRHLGIPGSTLPIGVEVQQTVFAFDRPGPLGDGVFLRYRIINDTPETFASLLRGVWTDPDLGGFLDDLIGTDVPRNMGCVHNADPQDDAYGTTPPALGVRLLGEPMEACTGYINGTDPRNTDEAMNLLRGLYADGSQIVDPVAQAVTRFMFPGNPVSGAGWLDGAAADKRLLLSTGGATLLPGDTLEVLVAIVIGRDADHITSISQLRCNADFVAQAYASGFTELDPLPGTPPCQEASACPRPLAFWQEQCLGGGIPPTGLQGIAQEADPQSAYFEWGSSAAEMCSTLHSAGEDVRSEAERQYAALLATVMAARLGIHDGDGKPIILSPLTPVNCPGITAETIADLVRTGYWNSLLSSVTYVDANPTNIRGLEGIDFGLPLFGGGAGAAFDFLGSTLDPVSYPDSFSTVEIRFSTMPQKAYRYLRHERASDGLAPPLGRRYTYAGFHDVPFQVWDTDRDVPLEVAFVERVLTDDAGTILPPNFQPVTFDSTWAPDATPVGGREYLIVFRNAYTGSPDPAFEVDGQLQLGAFPALYALAAKLRFEDSIVDPGDFVRYLWSRPTVTSIDQMLIDLESQPLEDPDVQAAYYNIVSCIQGLKDVCDIPTPALASLVHAVASPEAVDLAWYAPGVALARVQRSQAGDAWTTLTEVVRDGRDMIVWSDRTVVPGERYGYRLADERGQVHGETWVEVPATHRLSLAGTQPNPAGADARVVLSLRRRTAARLDVLDVAGRRVASREVGDLGPGTHVVRIKELDRLPAGVYLLRLSQDGESVTARMVRIR